MIGKCLLVLAAVSQIGAFKYNEESNSYSKPEKSVQSTNFKFTYQPAPANEKVPRIIATAIKSSPNQYMKPITRNIVARGKYPVTLQNSGPAPDRKIPVVTSHIRAPLQEKPTVRLQTKIPAPKTIAHTCTCYKTIVKPRVQQHLITVPSIQRYIETMHRPVVENIHYEAYPIGCLDSGNGGSSEGKGKNEPFQFEVSAPESKDKKNTEVFELPAGFELPKSQKPQVIEIPRVQFIQSKKPETVELPQRIELPRVQFIQSKKPETVELPQRIELPCVQFVQSKKPQTVELPQGIELPRVQFVEARKPEEIEIPRCQIFESKKPQIVEIPSAQFVESKPETVEMPRLEFVQAQKLQTVEIPRIQVAESPEVQAVEIPQQGETITLGDTPFMYQFKN